MPDYKYIFNNQSEKYDELVSKEDYENNLLKTLTEITSFSKKNIIEFGAGTGRLTFKLSNIAKTIFAMDISQSMLNTAIKKMKENNIKNVEFVQSDSLTLPKIKKKYDIGIEGWSFFAIVAFSKNNWEENNFKTIINKLVHNMIISTKRNSKLILIETLGTFEKKPNVPDIFSDIYSYLENEIGFKKKVIRTDYKFDTVEESADLMPFFFGEEYREIIFKEKMRIIPKCTGIWYKNNEKDDE